MKPWSLALEPTLEAAREHLAQGRLQDAKSLCSVIVAEEAHPNALHWLGYIAQQEGDFEGGADLCRRALEAGGDDWDLHLTLGLCLRGMGRLGEAYEALMASRRRNPAWPETAALLIECAGAGGLDQARALYDQIFAEDPLGAGKAQALRWLGYLAQQQGEYEDGADLCRRAIEAGGDDWDLFLILGLCLDAAGDAVEAHEALVASARRNPAWAQTASLLLKTAAQVGGLDLARARYEELFAAQGDPEIARAWTRLAFRHGVHPPADERGLRVCRQARPLEWAAAHGCRVIEAGEVEAIPIQAPPQDGNPAGPVTTIASNQPYVAELPDVAVFAKSHIILTPDGVALNDAGAHPLYGQYVSHRSDRAVLEQAPDALLLDVGRFQLRDLDAGVMLNGPASDAFGHWTTEFLPRLQFLERHPDFARLPIIVDDGMPQSHLDHLALIAPNPLVVLREGEGVRVKRLLYAPPPTFFPIHMLPNPFPPYVACACSPRAYRYLKTQVEARLGVPPPEGGKYYLSRRSTSWRRVSNEDAVRALLERRGYRTVFMETLSFEEQVRLFQGAASIVAPNGSAMQNLVFAPTDAQIVVLTQDNLHNLAAFYGQIRSLGYEPQLVSGPALGNPSLKHVDYEIPLAALEAALDAGRPIGP